MAFVLVFLPEMDWDWTVQSALYEGLASFWISKAASFAIAFAFN